MSASIVLGIDLGTTRTKVGLISTNGRAIGFARADHKMEMEPATGRAEQDPEAWWAGLGTAIRAAVSAATADNAGGTALTDPVAICVVGHGPSLTAVDSEGRAVRPAITWLDSRARGEQAELEEATGLRGWALGVLPAARWLERPRTDRGGLARVGLERSFLYDADPHVVERG